MLGLIKKLVQRINNHAERKEYPYRMFGIFACITYPLYHFALVYENMVGYENLYLRLVVVALSIPLILFNKWPEKLRVIFPLYWYGTITYAIPFLFTFFLLKNHLSNTSLITTMALVVLSILILDLIPLLVSLILGVGLGILVFYWVTPQAEIYFTGDLASLLMTYLSAFFFGAIFAHKREAAHYIKLQTLRSLSASMAHELRTPLRTISSGVTGIQRYFPSLLESYKTAREANLPVPEIPPAHHQALTQALETIKSEIQAAFTVIDMLSIKANMASIEGEVLTEAFSIHQAVDEALTRYPFDLGERELVTWPFAKFPNDFLVGGRKLLVIHVIFNLLKNALYYIRVANKGAIYIWLDIDDHYNYLHFKDTGAGIASEELPHVFDHFYSKTQHGTGIGLAFSRMVMQHLDGTINCYSRLGEYTEFVLKFPKLSKAQEKALAEKVS
jgi:signal transduction histidine kinase